MAWETSSGDGGDESATAAGTSGGPSEAVSVLRNWRGDGIGAMRRGCSVDGSVSELLGADWALTSAAAGSAACHIEGALAHSRAAR